MFLDLSKRMDVKWKSPVTDGQYVCSATGGSNTFTTAVAVTFCCLGMEGEEWNPRPSEPSMCQFSADALAQRYQNSSTRATNSNYTAAEITKLADPASYTKDRTDEAWKKCLEDNSASDADATCGDASTVKSAAAPGLRFGMTGTLAVVASVALAVLTL